MPAISFRKRQGLANLPGDTLSERVIPSLHMRGLSCLFADAPMGFDWKDSGIRLPEIAETETPPIRVRNPMPEAVTGSFTVIANHKGDDLSRPTAQDGPQPAFPCPFADTRPDLIDFQAVVWLRWRQCRLQRRQRVDFFLIHTARALRDTPNMRRMPRILGRS